MTIGLEFWKELKLEAKLTRRFLEQIPFDQAHFKPAERSESLGRLAIYVAEIIAWWSSTINDDELNFLNFEPVVIDSTDQLLAYFDRLLLEAKDALISVADNEFIRHWSMKYGDEILFSLPKKQVVRIFCMNHLVHHRAQLGVYLRLLDIDVPASYGPSADDDFVILTVPFTL